MYKDLENENSAIRFATGAFRISPAVSLCAETGIPSLDFRRLTLTAKLLTTIIRTPDIPVYDAIFHPLPAGKKRSFEFHCLPPIPSSTPPWMFTPPTSYSLSLSFLKIQLPLQFTALTSTKLSIPSLTPPSVTRMAQKVTTESALHFL